MHFYANISGGDNESYFSETGDQTILNFRTTCISRCCFHSFCWVSAVWVALLRNWSASNFKIRLHLDIFDPRVKTGKEVSGMF